MSKQLDKDGNQFERVIVKELSSDEWIHATLHYDKDSDDIELASGDTLLESGSWPLQSYEIVRFLDRVENLIQVFNKYFRFNVTVSAEKTITAEFDGSFSHSGPHSMLGYDRPECHLESALPESDAHVSFESVEDEESLLMDLVNLLGPIVRDEAHSLELLKAPRLFAGLLP